MHCADNRVRVQLAGNKKKDDEINFAINITNFQILKTYVNHYQHHSNTDSKTSTWADIHPQKKTKQNGMQTVHHVN